MASAEKVLTVNSFAQLPLSTSMAPTPGGISTIGQIGPGSFEGGTPSLAQQEISQAQQNLSQGIIVQPSISATPNISPFPLGCPSGFYQSGDVCIPTVDTAGQNLPNAPAAGSETPKGQIQQTVIDNTTTLGAPFYVTCYFMNRAILGRFFLHVTIQAIGVDVTSTGVWIPEGQNGVLYKQIVMPTTAANCPANGYSAVIQLLHEDNRTGQMITDDNDNVSVPCPGSVPNPVTPTPPFQQTCFVANDGTRWCSSPTNTGGNCQPDPTNPGLFWCQMCSCGANQKWNSCICGCVPSASLIPDCPTTNCPQCGTQTPTPTPTPTPTTPSCPTGYTYDTTRNVCVQNPQPAPVSNMPQCFTISIDGLFRYASQYSRFVEIRQPNQLIIIATGRGTRSSDDLQFCQTTTATEDSVTINGVIYAPHWPSPPAAHMARAYAAGKPSCFTVTIPALLEQAGRGGVHIRNPPGLIAELKRKGLALNNTSISFCLTSSMSADDTCIDIGGATYCPQMTHSENNHSVPVMSLSPSNNVGSGGTVTVNLTNFAPNEQVTITEMVVTNPVGANDVRRAEWQNRRFQLPHSGTTDSNGNLRTMIQLPGLPIGVKAHVLIQAQGSRSMKQTQRDIIVS